MGDLKQWLWCEFCSRAFAAVVPEVQWCAMKKAGVKMLAEFLLSMWDWQTCQLPTKEGLVEAYYLLFGVLMITSPEFRMVCDFLEGFFKDTPPDAMAQRATKCLDLETWNHRIGQFFPGTS